MFDRLGFKCFCFFVCFLLFTQNTVAEVASSDGMFLTGQQTEAYLTSLSEVATRVDKVLSPYRGDTLKMEKALFLEFKEVFPVEDNSNGDFILVGDGIYYMQQWEIKHLLFGSPSGPFEARFLQADNNPNVCIYIAQHHEDNLKEVIRVEVAKDDTGSWFIPFMSVDSPDIKVDSAAFGKEPTNVATGAGLNQWYSVINYKKKEGLEIKSVYDYIDDVFFDKETRGYAIENSQVSYELQYNMKNFQ